MPSDGGGHVGMLLRRTIPCGLLMLFGPVPLSVGNTSHMQSVMAVSTPKEGGERRV
jgi:hypothetical protein